MPTWESAILEAIRRLGGRNVALQDIYVEMRKSPVVTSRHLNEWATHGQPRYECWIRRCLTTLIRKRAVVRVATATYSLA